MAEKKLVIKINQERAPAKPAEVEMITEWNIPRIILLAIVILLLGGLLIYIFSKNPATAPVIKQGEQKEAVGKTEISNSTNTVKKIQAPTTPQKKPEILIAAIEAKQNHQQASVISEEKDSRQNKPAGDNPVIIRILDKRISRAVIAESLSEKEPVNIFSKPIKADKDKAVGVYFFTEINGMKGQQLYHQWFYKNKLIFKRKIHILGNQWRASTSKLIVHSQKGEWRAVLASRKGQPLAEVTFIVN